VGGSGASASVSRDSLVQRMEEYESTGGCLGAGRDSVRVQTVGAAIAAWPCLRRMGRRRESPAPAECRYARQDDETRTVRAGLARRSCRCLDVLPGHARFAEEPSRVRRVVLGLRVWWALAVAASLIVTRDAAAVLRHQTLLYVVAVLSLFTIAACVKLRISPTAFIANVPPGVWKRIRPGWVAWWLGGRFRWRSSPVQSSRTGTPRTYPCWASRCGRSVSRSWSMGGSFRWSTRRRRPSGKPSQTARSFTHSSRRVIRHCLPRSPIHPLTSSCRSGS
jgi:hypothetical protein